ncbi:MAG: beta-galactosidase [bacterium]|nr:MAG: beta-galactosidase [bacterium]
MISIRRLFVYFSLILVSGVFGFFTLGCDGEKIPTSSSGIPANLQKKPQPPPPSVTKTISFSILEDYDKGQDLNDIALDFQLMNELEIDTWRGSFGWDDYEPTQSQYDFTWLHNFVSLAEQYGIMLRPYICYAPPWAGDGDWNSPPNNYQDWYNFCYNLASALSSHSNILSYEIWNEENDEFWFDGTLEQYKELLMQGANAIRAGDPNVEIILGGLVWPHYEWIDGITSAGYAQYYEITPFHCYAETWSRNNVVMENYLDEQYYDWFVPTNNNQGENEPIWVNEIGYATTPGKTEADQANFMCRAVSTLFADAEIKHIGWYEIKDLPEGSPVIGDETNYYLGMTYTDLTKKLAFYTLDMLTDLLDGKTITTADAGATVTVTSGRARELFHHLFKFQDDSQVLFIYEKENDITVDVALETPGTTAYKYELNGSSSVYPSFTNNTISNLVLTAGNVALFKIVL